MFSRNLFFNLIIIALLALLQVFVFNNIVFFEKYTPFIYIIWIMFYPSKLNKGVFLILSFSLGFIIDLFSDTGGVHALASLFLAQFKFIIVKLISLKDMESDEYVFSEFNFGQLLSYIFLICLFHHLIYYLAQLLVINNVSTIDLVETLKIAGIAVLFSTVFIFIIYSFFKNWIK